jgi:anti-sigma regulatory factor (Ser/Thr protein kinase)
MTTAFRHEALITDGPEQGTAETIVYLRAGLGEGAATTVLAGAERCHAISRSLGSDASAIWFQPLEELGPNPARLIPFWSEQLARSRASGQRLHAVSEALAPGRTADHITEFGISETLINVAFDGGPGWSLLCPFDTTRHGPATIDLVRATHPFISEHGVSGANPDYRPAAPFGGVLSAPPADAEQLPFTTSDLPILRRIAFEAARASGLERRADDLTLVVTELATNSIRHGGGGGTFVQWPDDEGLIVEIRDAGHITEPLAGRVKPYGAPGRTGGAGLWIANLLSDLLQIRSGPSGTTVRAQFRRGAR